MEKLPGKDSKPIESVENPETHEASKESIETLRQLREFLDQGFVFHGSKRKSEILEPQQARDTDSNRTIGQQLAVYGTDKYLEIPLFMAMKDFKDSTNHSMHSGYSGRDGKFYMHGENTTLTPGYVYVLPRDTFEVMQDEKGNEELMSKSSVMPIAVFRVEPDIFSLFPNVTLDLK